MQGPKQDLRLPTFQEMQGLAVGGQGPSTIEIQKLPSIVKQITRGQQNI